MISAVLAVVMLCGIIPANTMVSKAATTANVSLSSLGRKGTVSFGSKSKSGTWWKMRLGSKEAFCLSLGHTCHSGNTYAAENSYKWNQDTGGEKHGYYAKIIRWYVLNGKRTQKSFVMSQALIWSVSEGRNSEARTDSRCAGYTTDRRNTSGNSACCRFLWSSSCCTYGMEEKRRGKEIRKVWQSN